MTTSPRFLVTWEINIDDDEASTPEQAALSALEIVNEARPGDPEGANCFHVTDTVTDQIHLIDLGGNPDDHTRVSHWPRPIGSRLEPVLNETDAACLIDHRGHATLRVRISKEDFLSGFAEYSSGLIAQSEQVSHFDKLHELAYSFGEPANPAINVVGVDGSDFLVDYTTDLSPYLPKK